MPKYKSQTTSFVPILLILIIVLFLFETFGLPPLFTFVPSLHVTILLIIALIIFVIFFILSRLQGYELLDDKIRIQHVTKFNVPFSEIKNVTLLSQDNYLRLRGTRPDLFSRNIRLNNKVIGQAFNSSFNLEESKKDIGFSLNEFNKETTLAKLKALNTKVLFIQTEKGEVRILPSDPDNFLVDLAAKYQQNQGKVLNIQTKKIEI